MALKWYVYQYAGKPEGVVLKQIQGFCAILCNGFIGVNQLCVVSG